MYTIWFRIPNTSGALSVSVPGQVNLNAAREVWDRLNKEFEMVCARP